MAKRFGVQVYGYDLSVNMINIANDLRMEQKANVKHAVQFYVEDATLMDYPDQFYDMVYSRDTILHIKDKKALFEMFYRYVMKFIFGGPSMKHGEVKIDNS